MVHPPLPPGTPGWQYNPTLNTPPAVAGQLQAQAAIARQAAAEAALAERRQRMAGRWFTPEHGWIAISGEIATVGLSDYAAQGLRDILYVSLPVVGATVTAGDPCGQVESTKAISDLYAPVDGEVSEVNERLAGDPGLVNEEPFGDGWLFRMVVAIGADGALRAGLLSPEQYEELTKGIG